MSAPMPKHAGGHKGPLPTSSPLPPLQMVIELCVRLIRIGASTYCTSLWYDKDCRQYVYVIAGGTYSYESRENARWAM